MRGVEEMFLPLDDPETDALFEPGELAKMRKEELARAEEQVFGALKHWVDFFANSPKYIEVGRVLREPGWEEREEKRRLCDAASKGRKKRKVPTG